ncbi:hypothetical protein SSS_06999 [Sarcoptes scabiei]|uniref:Uncharacterized protein n=1 Tax=Sarcoptes scabiei TaxID=52283 RepID=A0A834RGN7_SARSC|nr:hypothetical protein SSS_06999 [Sarcoptes scabiei]
MVINLLSKISSIKNSLNSSLMMLNNGGIGDGRNVGGERKINGSTVKLLDETLPQANGGQHHSHSSQSDTNRSWSKYRFHDPNDQSAIDTNTIELIEQNNGFDLFDVDHPMIKTFTDSNQSQLNHCERDDSNHSNHSEKNIDHSHRSTSCAIPIPSGSLMAATTQIDHRGIFDESLAMNSSSNVSQSIRLSSSLPSSKNQPKSFKMILCSYILTALFFLVIIGVSFASGMIAYQYFYYSNCDSTFTSSDSRTRITSPDSRPLIDSNQRNGRYFRFNATIPTVIYENDRDDYQNSTIKSIEENRDRVTSPPTIVPNIEIKNLTESIEKIHSSLPVHSFERLNSSSVHYDHDDDQDDDQDDVDNDVDSIEDGDDGDDSITETTTKPSTAKPLTTKHVDNSSQILYTNDDDDKDDDRSITTTTIDTNSR